MKRMAFRNAKGGDSSEQPLPRKIEDSLKKRKGKRTDRGHKYHSCDLVQPLGRFIYDCYSHGKCGAYETPLSRIICGDWSGKSGFGVADVAGSTYSAGVSKGSTLSDKSSGSKSKSSYASGVKNPYGGYDGGVRSSVVGLSGGMSRLSSGSNLSAESKKSSPGLHRSEISINCVDKTVSNGSEFVTSSQNAPMAPLCKSTLNLKCSGGKFLTLGHAACFIVKCALGSSAQGDTFHSGSLNTGNVSNRLSSLKINCHRGEEGRMVFSPVGGSSSDKTKTSENGRYVSNLSIRPSSSVDSKNRQSVRCVLKGVASSSGTSVSSRSLNCGSGKINGDSGFQTVWARRVVIR